MRLTSILFLLILSSTPLANADEPVVLVVTTSLLEAAARDYLPVLPKGIEIIRLIPPGSCPGHFDLSPRSVPLLRRAKLIVRHDFQQALDGPLRRLGGEDLRVAPVSAKGSLLVPANYTILSAALAEVFADIWPDRAVALRAQRDALAKETARLGEATLTKARPWRGTPVISSVQQQAFCSWLGLAVVQTLPRPDDTSPRQLAQLLRSKVTLVVGNLQSDAKAARALAERKHVPLAVLSNFPARAQNGYRELLAANLKQLEAAWQTRSQP